MNDDEFNNEITPMLVDDTLRPEVFRLIMAKEALSQENAILKQKVTHLTLELALRKTIAENDERIHSYEKQILEKDKQLLEDEIDYYYDCQENGESFKVRPVSRILRIKEDS